MNERTRYRVTGSVFLIALAVIFLPMLFDGAGAPTRSVPQLPQQSPAQAPLPKFEDVVPTSDVVARVEELRAEVDEEGFANATDTRFGEPVLQRPDTATSVWAVQAASFASLENARAFRQDLRDAGFEAFISTVKDRSSDSGQMHRVAVGPFLSNVDARQIQAELGDQFGVEPAVVEMTQ